MKVLQYNILYGCLDNRFTSFSSWIKSQNHHDVMGFNEMNDWTGEKLRLEAANWGYPCSYLFETESSPFFIGVISKYPIEVISSNEQSFHHALVHVKIKGVHFFLTHLTPFDSVQREEETNLIAQYIASIQEPALLMGDLNAFSPLDHSFHEQMELDKYFLAKDNTRQTKDGALNYQPIQTLLDAGLHDAGFDGEFDYSIPTNINNDLDVNLRRRIDYVLVNDTLKSCNPVASIIHEPEVEQLSDHYPVTCSWEDK